MVDPKPPKMGQIVLYEMNDGSGVLLPAIVVRTKSDKARPEAPELPNDYTVDLRELVWGEMIDAVGYHPPVKGPNEAGISSRTWHYPPK